jgi:hypothetical protein
MKSRFDFLGVCCLALAVVLVCPQDVFGQTITLPPQPFWHFAVRSADQSVISIIFSGTWVAPDGSSGFSEQRYQVQRSSTPDFSKPLNIPGPYTNLGVTWMAVDSGVGPSSTLPYYRVVLYSGSGQNSILTTSPPMQPYEQAGKIHCVYKYTYHLTFLIVIQILDLILYEKKGNPLWFSSNPQPCTQ